MYVDPEIVRRLDDSIRVDFQAFRDYCFDWLIASSVMVMVGVALEGPELLFEMRQLWRGWRNATVARRGTPAWMKVVGTLGWALVVLGVVGEGLSESFVSRADGYLQTFNETLLAGAITEASLAESTGATLAAQVSSDRARAKQSELQIASAQVKISEAQKAIAEAERDAAEARSMAASADLARAELEDRIAPRTLSVERRISIGKFLSPFARQMFGRRIKLDWPLSDIEPTIFGIELEDSLKRAGIDADRPNVVSLGGGIKIGIAITGPARDGALINRLYVILHGDFPKEAMTAEANSKYEGSPVTITIGVKTPIGIETLPAAPAVPRAPPKPTVDRHLTPEQKSIAARDLFPFRGERIIFLIMPGDKEVFGIATDIDLALGAARWIRSPGKPPPNIGRLRGILINVGKSATDTDRNAADWLTITLREAHLDVIGPVQLNENTVAPITIMIGANQ